MTHCAITINAYTGGFFKMGEGDTEELSREWEELSQEIRISSFRDRRGIAPNKRASYISSTHEQWKRSLRTIHFLAVITVSMHFISPTEYRISFFLLCIFRP